jgi:FtsH ternary system domain X6
MSRADAPPEPADPSGPPAVSRFEYNLLRLLRFAVGHMPIEQALGLISAKQVPPPCLSAVCVKLAEQTLATACVLALVRSGGWRADGFLRGDKPATGRAWERAPLAERELEFGELPLSFLMWLTAEKPTDTEAAKWDPPAADLTPGDALFFWLAFDAFKGDPALLAALGSRKVFRDNPLCRLMAPGEFVTEDTAGLRFAPWMSGPRAAILECLQPALAARWIRSERGKGQIEDWRRMRETGTAETRTLEAFLAAADAAKRPDLARFLLKTASAILTQPDLTPGYWTAGLRGTGPGRLADRLETQRVALAMPRQLETLQAWDRRARSVGYFDDEYAAAQWWKGEWEAANGEALTATARRLLDQLEPLRTG